MQYFNLIYGILTNIKIYVNLNANIVLNVYVTMCLSWTIIKTIHFSLDYLTNSIKIVSLIKKII